MSEHANDAGSGHHGAPDATLTVAEWVDSLTPAPPPALLARLRELLAPHAGRPYGEAPDACLAAGEAQLAALLAEGATDRNSALDLLTIDALVTYAFQAAADRPEELEALTRAAMSRIAAIPETP